jgi:hypothetical protein
LFADHILKNIPTSPTKENLDVGNVQLSALLNNIIDLLKESRYALNLFPGHDVNKLKLKRELAEATKITSAMIAKTLKVLPLTRKL